MKRRAWKTCWPGDRLRPARRPRPCAGRRRPGRARYRRPTGLGQHHAGRGAGPGLADLPAAHVPMDGFHLADVELDRLGRRDRKGAPDTFDAAGYAALLHRLHTHDADIVFAPGFERVLEQPIAGAIPIPRQAPLVVTEGNYLLVPDPPWDRVRAQLTEAWYVDLDEPERLRRLIARHVAFGKPPAAAEAWATGTDERNAALVRSTRRYADLVVSSARDQPWHGR